MRYYIRADQHSSVRGPCTVAEIISAVREKRIHTHSLVSSDIGDSPETLQRYRPADWFSLWDIPEVRSIASAFASESNVLREPAGARMRDRLIAGALLVGAGGLLISGPDRPGEWMALVIAIAGAVSIAIRIQSRRRKQSITS